MQSIVTFFKESKEELRKVNWPSKAQTINYTMVVVAASLAVAIFLGGLDLGFSKLVSRFIF